MSDKLFAIDALEWNTFHVAGGQCNFVVAKQYILMKVSNKLFQNMAQRTTPEKGTDFTHTLPVRIEGCA